eukprot:1972878-Alexandrium_andersonii.AAC.1
MFKRAVRFEQHAPLLSLSIAIDSVHWCAHNCTTTACLYDTYSFLDLDRTNNHQGRAFRRPQMGL